MNTERCVGIGADASLKRLRELIAERWLPAFVAANPGTSLDAYHEIPRNAPPLSDEEAAGFLRALDEGVLRPVRDAEGRDTGLARLPGYRFYYCTSVIYRPVKSLPDVHLWREWLTHAAVAARLHLDYGYPKHQLAIDEDAFDVVVHGRHNEPIIAIEAKKTRRELDQLVARLFELGRAPFDPGCGAKLSNSEKKYRGLLALQPAVFWAVAPGCEQAFDVTHSRDPAAALLRERPSIPCFGSDLSSTQI